MEQGVNSQEGLVFMFRTEVYDLVDKNLVMERLKGVLDPEIGRSIVDLNMVREIVVADGNVTVKIALTVAHCPLAKTLQTDVETAVRALEEVRSVKVDTTTMTRRELEELKLKLQPSPSSSPKTSPKVSPGIESLGKRGVRSIIAIISGKGGVGKSFITSVLASELRRRGYEVGVLDADLTGPSIAKVLGVAGKPYKGPSGSIVPVETKTGIKVMSINLVLDDPSMPVIWRGPIVNSVIRQLYLDGVVVVSSPQDLASMIVSKAVNMAKKMDAPILGLVENMSYLKCPSCGERVNLFGEPKGERLASSLGLPFLGSIPLDPSIALLSDEGRIEDYSSPIIASIADELRTRAAKQVEHPIQGLPIAWSIEPAQ